MDKPKPLLSAGTKEHVYHCAKCGLCLEVCPVYRELLVESASPRGKVQLAKHIIEGNLDITRHMSEILFSQCLLCGSCVAACPSGVDQAALFSGLRWRATERHGIPLVKKLFFYVLAHKWIMSSSAWFGRWARKIFSGLKIEDHILLGNLSLAGVPPFNKTFFNDETPEVVSASGGRKGRVLYFHGCATNYVFADIGHSVVSVLSRMGLDVTVPKGQSCCGLPVFLSGDRKTSLKCMEENLTLFARDEFDAVIVDCATCGSALRKEYPHILRELRDLGEPIGADMIEKAELLASKVRDVSEFVAEHMHWLPEMEHRGPEVRVTYHDPCHLLKGQGVGSEPRKILRAIPGIKFVEMNEAGTCCGGGGEFQIEHGETSALITERKLGNIYDVQAEVVATGCPGCNITIGAHLDKTKGIQVMHPLQLLQRALPDKK
ncbi:MAG: (Fe-S)-binding protein [Deltaproteobacteria bacterium]|nr:(Fe-S)-binding protein [Deltaproteobacteria bacterium]